MRAPRKMLALAAAAAVALAAGLLLQIGPASAASLTQVTNFGTNPTQLEMYVYRPASAPAKPAVVVAVHYCTGSGPGFFADTGLAALADQYGFIAIFPSVTQTADKCYDVASSAALTRNGGSDPVGIRSMVSYAEQNYNTDTSRVYVLGESSGAMMTNVLLGNYPDVFKAGAAFAGVPFGCFAGIYAWNSECADGQITKTPPQWGDLVRAAYPGYTGARPRMQLWHGTDDGILNYVNFGEEIKQWTNVLGVSQTPTSTDSPAATITRTRYANAAGVVQVEANSLAGAPHSLPLDIAAAIHFFGLDGSTTTPTATATQTASPTATPTATPTVTPTVSPTTVSPTVIPTTVIPTTVTPTSPAPTTAGTGCTATFSVTNSWGSGFVGSVRVTAGSAAISKWTVGLTLPSGTTIANAWNGVVSGSSVSAAAWNGSLPAGSSTEFGFQGAGPSAGVGVASCVTG